MKLAYPYPYVDIHSIIQQLNIYIGMIVPSIKYLHIRSSIIDKQYSVKIINKIIKWNLLGIKYIQDMDIQGHPYLYKINRKDNII